MVALTINQMLMSVLLENTTAVLVQTVPIRQEGSTVCAMMVTLEMVSIVQVRKKIEGGREGGTFCCN